MKMLIVLNAGTGVQDQAPDRPGQSRDHAFPLADAAVFYTAPAQQDPAIQVPQGQTTWQIKVQSIHAETVLDILTERFGGYDLYLFPAGVFGDEIAVRFAARMNGSALANVAVFEAGTHKVCCKKPVYSGYMQATFELDRFPVCLSLSPKAMPPLQGNGPPTGQVREVDETGRALPGHILKQAIEARPSSGDLDAADFLVVGGNGMENRAGAEALKKEADDLGAAFGVSRPAAMGGFAPMHRLIGVSGTFASPRICIAAGVSGAPAFFSGIENSGMIIALNTDSTAPIISKADLAVIGDYRPVMAELARIAREDNAQDC